ncbi:fructose-1,6-bisphosphatase class 1-like [Condylostylus longicornis]|uniref:fructose-1,6-bisphosphatase class 1-like n=1 Tax=Condylostylus longicornis TaxID=2530218 RepID=UPI00244DBABF|nr:fructose-1,6-bisphosphatase class 1-like [Condylostylus longicornis]
MEYTGGSSVFGDLSAKPVPELGEYVIAHRKDIQKAGGSDDEINRLLTAIKLAAKVVNREINKAGLTDILGSASNINIQGETQQKLDVLANVKFMQALRNREVVCGICSEEDDDFIPVNPNASYVVLMDPLDGSSNIDVNAAVGTIFSVYKRVSPVGSPVELEDFLQPGRNQIVAGYVVYGSSTIMVVSFGKGVHGFTLEPSLGTFFLSHPNMKFPTTEKIYSVNQGNFLSFPEAYQKYIHWCSEEPNERPYSLRYIGSLIADFHRNLLKGGIFLYPPTMKDPNGKLRLLYECNPIAFLAEHADGKATSGTTPILDIKPTKLHQRGSYVVRASRPEDSAVTVEG